MVNVSVQYEVIRAKVYEAHYSLQNATVNGREYTHSLS
jgi:hypothetical protein